MKRLVEFPLEEGVSILVQIDKEDAGGTIRAGRYETNEIARDIFEEALNRVLPAAKECHRETSADGKPTR